MVEAIKEYFKKQIKNDMTEEKIDMILRFNKELCQIAREIGDERIEEVIAEIEDISAYCRRSTTVNSKKIRHDYIDRQQVLDIIKEKLLKDGESV